MKMTHTLAEPGTVVEHGSTITTLDTRASAEPWRLYSTRRRWLFLSVLFLVATANYFDYFILSVLLEPIKLEFHVSDTMLGLLSGFCFALVYAAAAFPMARWADRGDRCTVVTVSLMAWSCMTMLCGVAQSFFQLALARFGVGASEPGALPSAQSLISDYFPPEQRAVGLATLSNGGSAAGWLVGIGFGSYVAAWYGWRTAFLLAGGLSFVLAIVVKMTLAEPRKSPGFSGRQVAHESTVETMSRLRNKRSFVLSLTGISIYTVFAYGMMVFVPSFLVRSLHASLVDVSIRWGVLIATANLVGAIAGGAISDRLGRRDKRWYAWVPAFACIVATPLYWLAFRSTGIWPFIGMEFVAEFVISMGVPVVFAIAHSVCGARRRVTASAAIFGAMGLIGGNLGPLFVGALSDAFADTYGPDSLRRALLAASLFLIPAAAAFWWSSSFILAELEE